MPAKFEVGGRAALSSHGSMDGKATVQALNDLVRESLDEKRFEQFILWPKMAAYANTLQWLTSRDSRYWNALSAVSRDRRITWDLIRPRRRQFISILMRAKPGWSVLPKEGEEGARSRARSGRAFLETFVESPIAIQARQLATAYLADYGAGWMMPFFDPTRGPVTAQFEPVRDPGTGQPVQGIDGQQIDLRDENGRKVPIRGNSAGMIGIKSYSPLQVFPPVGERSPFSSDWWYVIVAEVTNKGDLKRTYGSKADGLETSGQPSEFGLDTRQRISSIAHDDEGFHRGQAEGAEGIVVFKYYETASSAKGAYPVGREVHWAGDKILRDKPLDVPGVWPPLHGLYGDITDGTPFPKGLVESLTPMADFANRVASRILRWMQLSLDPRILVPAGSGLTAEKLKPGQSRVIFYDPLRGQPTWMTPPPLPNAIFELLGMIEVAADRVSSMQPMARGEITRGMPQATVMQLVQEAQEAVLSSYAQLSAASWSHMGRHILGLASTMNSDQLLRLVGPKDAVELVKVAPGSLSDDVHIEVQESSLLPRLRAARRLWVRENHSQGIYGNPQDPVVQKFVRRELDEPVTVETADPHEADRLFAEDEDFRILEVGQPVSVTPQDNHDVHLLQHRLRTRSTDYRAMPPRALEAHQQHIVDHENALQQQQQQAFQEQLQQTQAMAEAEARGEAIKSQIAAQANVEAARAAAIARGDRPADNNRE